MAIIFIGSTLLLNFLANVFFFHLAESTKYNFFPYVHNSTSFHQSADEYAVKNERFKSIVSQTEPGAYRNAAPIGSKVKHYIQVKAGFYYEYLEVWQNQTNIVLIGDGASTTIVRGERHYPTGTNNTGTISISGDGFIAKFICFENMALNFGQAAAAVVDANYVAFFKCTFRRSQDTLYAQSGIQFYKNCDIYGTVDFICGAAAAVFQDCNLYANRTGEIVFTAQQRNSPATAPPSGFVIQNCNLAVAPEFESKKNQVHAYLGRPWGVYSTVVVMESHLDSIIQPAGWLDWPNVPNNNVYYREFKNDGDGSRINPERRKKWGVLRNPEMMKSFTVGEFINKDGWLRRTRIPYYDGFKPQHKVLLK